MSLRPVPPWRRVLAGRQGSILIGLIFTMLVFATLGTVMLRLNSTATDSQVDATFSTRSYYLAESGYRYLASEYLGASTFAARMAVLEGADGSTFHMANNQGDFQLQVHPYWLITTASHATGATTVATKVPGSFSSHFVLPSPASVKIGTIIYANATIATTIPNLASITVPGGLLEDVSQDSGVYLVSYPNSGQTVSAGSSLVLQSGTPGMFPARNGQVEIELKMFLYQRATPGSGTVTLEGLSGSPGDFPVSVTTATPVILKKFLEVASVGSAGSGFTLVNRTITYNTPVPDTVEMPSTPDNQPVVDEDFQDLTSWDVPQTDNRVSIQGFQAQNGTHSYWMAIRNLSTGENREPDPQNPSCNIGFHTVRLATTSAIVQTLQEAWADHGHLLSYDAQAKVGWGYLLDYGVSGIGFRWHRPSPSEPTLWAGYGLSFMRYQTRPTVCASPMDGDFIPDAIKPPGKAGRLLLVLWDQGVSGTSVSRRWLAYADLGDPANRPAARDPKVVGSQWQYDGKVNDNATVTVRIEEKKINGVPLNDIKAFYGDASTLYGGRLGNALATDLTVRLPYSPSWVNPALWPKWPANQIASWLATGDYFSLAAEYPPAPDNALFWTINSAAADVQLLPDERTVRSRIFITNSLSSFPTDRAELGLNAFGRLSGNFNESIAFDDFSLQLLGGYASGSGGGFMTTVQQ
ncbi:MAG: hypothetical protein AB1634_16230 [Thermodesulfobacteriota bacterium]